MRKFFMLLALACGLVASAAQKNPADTLAADTSSAVTLASDTVIDDTSSYTISTTIPKGITRSIDSIFNNIDDDGFFSQVVAPFAGMFGVSLVFFLIVFLLLPLAILIFLIWFIVHNRNKARKADMDAFAHTPYSTEWKRQSEASETTDHTADRQPAQKFKSYYAHRLDNAILNIAIGAGILAVSALFYITIGIAVGIVVLCVGIADYIIYRRHASEAEDSEQDEYGENGKANGSTPTPQKLYYIRKRDNATLYIVIGLGTTIAATIFHMHLFMAAGIIVLCIGVANYIICRNHRND